MSTSRRTVPRARTVALVCADALAYVLAVVALATLTALVVGIATGGGLLRAKALLFVGGLLLLAYATVRLWPTSIEDVEEPTGRSVPREERSRFARFTRRLPPARWVASPPPQWRLTPAGKLFWSAVGVLAVSFLLETAFGVA